MKPELAALYKKYGLEPRSNPYEHQADGLLTSRGTPFFAQLGEQGTGKTWILINEAAFLFANKAIDRVLVLAPKGVDENWLKDEVPKHLPIGIVPKMALWRAGGGLKKQREALNLLFDRVPARFSLTAADIVKAFELPAGVLEEKREMKWLFMNWEAIATKDGFACAEAFVKEGDALVIGDEAQRIKSKDSARAKALLKLKPHAKFRRIATGTPITNDPFDLFMPFMFLSPTILGSSFVVFKSEYAQLVKPGSPFYHSIFQRMKDKMRAEGNKLEDSRLDVLVSRRMPQLIEKDELGHPIYKNLDKLQEKIKPHVFRVLKKDCLDLPEKIYTKRYFSLTAEQARHYEEIKERLRIVLADDTIQPLTAMTAIWKLMQVTSGFFIETATQEVHKIAGDNPKVDLLRELLEDIDGKIIIWANYTAEFEIIRAACEGRNVVEYHGGVSDLDRSAAVQSFQHGAADVFIGHPKSGGTGLTLHAASNMIYFSNSFSMEDRAQSEDRAHRIGQKLNLTIFDLVASGTIEERVIDILQVKSELASTIIDALKA